MYEFRQKDYWVVEVGDDPGDESCRGPFNTLEKAVRQVDSYHGTGWVNSYRQMLSFNGQISSVFVIWNCEDNPKYQSEIMERLKERKS